MKEYSYEAPFGVLAVSVTSMASESSRSLADGTAADVAAPAAANPCWGGMISLRYVGGGAAIGKQ